MRTPMALKVASVLMLMLVLSMAATSSVQADSTIETLTFTDFAVQPGPSPAANCGDSGVYLISALHWASFPVTYTIDASSSGIDPSAAAQAVISALDVWDTVPFPHQQFFSEAAVGATPRLSITWVPASQWPFGGAEHGLAVTILTYNVFTKEIVHASILFNGGISWGILSGTVCFGPNIGTTFDIQDAATHEIGHVLGLHHPCNLQTGVCNPDTFPLTMCSCASFGETYKRTLATGDILGVEALYSNPSPVK